MKSIMGVHGILIVVSGLFQPIVYANEIENDQQNNSQEKLSQLQEKKEDACEGGKKDKYGHCVLFPEEKIKWSIKPKLLTGVMYFNHITLLEEPLSNKPVPFGGLGLNVSIGNWFLNGYGLDTAKTTDHIFLPDDPKEKKTYLTETNYKFQRQDYAITLGREITDLFTNSDQWGFSLFVGYRQGKTIFTSNTVTFNDTTKGKDGNFLPDKLFLAKGEYIVKGPMVGIGLRVKPLEGNSQLGLTVGYGPLHGKYTRPYYDATAGKSLGDRTENGNVNTWVTALSWEGELTDKLSYSLVFDYYAYNMPIPQGENNALPFILKESVGSAKLFLNYRFN